MKSAFRPSGVGSPRDKIIRQINNNETIEETIKLASEKPIARKILKEKTKEHCHCSRSERRLLVEPKRSMMRSVSGKSIKAMSDRLSQNRSPCRRSCSTTHNPMFHIPRFNMKILANGEVQDKN